MGGYWAYTTLGWGGFWAWDPVETSGLLPWLACTTFLHAAVMGKRKRHYALLGPLLAMLVLLLVLVEGDLSLLFPAQDLSPPCQLTPCRWLAFPAPSFASWSFTERVASGTATRLWRRRGTGVGAISTRA